LVKENKSTGTRKRGNRGMIACQNRIAMGWLKRKKRLWGSMGKTDSKELLKKNVEKGLINKIMGDD